jgi:nicotinamide riboside transporter PnuC
MMKWIGTIASIIGSFLVAMTFAGIGYIFFLIGSGAWLYVAIKSKDYPLLILNLTFFVANIIGIWNYVIRS